MSKASEHKSKLCCVVQSIGTLYGQPICKPCIRHIVRTSDDAQKEETFNEVLAILNAFTPHEKN